MSSYTSSLAVVSDSSATHPVVLEQQPSCIITTTTTVSEDVGKDCVDLDLQQLYKEARPLEDHISTELMDSNFLCGISRLVTYLQRGSQAGTTEVLDSFFVNLEGGAGINIEFTYHPRTSIVEDKEDVDIPTIVVTEVPDVIVTESPALEVSLPVTMETPVIVEETAVIIDTPVVIETTIITETPALEVSLPVIIEAPLPIITETPVVIATASKIPIPTTSRIAVPTKKTTTTDKVSVAPIASKIAVPVSKFTVPALKAIEVSVPAVASKIGVPTTTKKNAKVSVPVEVKKIEQRIKLETPRKALKNPRKALSALSAPPQAEALPKKAPISLTNRVSLIKRRPVLHPEIWANAEWI